MWSLSLLMIVSMASPVLFRDIFTQFRYVYIHQEWIDIILVSILHSFCDLCSLITDRQMLDFCL